MSGGRRAAVVGVGLIGGSIGLGLRARGWHVTGRDRDPERAARSSDRSLPVTCHPCRRKARPIDPPIRPVPTIWARLFGEVIPQALRPLQVDVVQLRP